jgi:hypothetical protein
VEDLVKAVEVRNQGVVELVKVVGVVDVVKAVEVRDLGVEDSVTVAEGRLQQEARFLCLCLCLSLYLHQKRSKDHDTMMSVCCILGIISSIWFTHKQPRHQKHVTVTSEVSHQCIP